MSYNALSLSQSPRLWVPLRFLLSAPLFLLLAGLLLLFAPDKLFVSRWNPTVLALTHLVTLGFLGTSMIGALQQLIPVLVGVVMPRAERLSQLLYALWIPGTLLLVAGMNWGWQPGLQSGALLLGLTLLILVIMGGHALWRSNSRHATIPAMALAMFGLVVGVAIAISLLWTYHWQVPLAHAMTRLHIGWTAVSWVAILVIGVAYQVVPMFQLTGPYPIWLRRTLAPALVLTLLLWSIWPWPLLSILIVVLLGGFALTTLWLQLHRRRQLADATLDFWRIGMVSLLLAGFGWLWWLYQPSPQVEILIGVLFLAGFATAAVNGMLYKIVPFLIWLHLNNQLQQAGQWQGKVPNMKQIIPQLHARRQLWLYLLALLMLVAVLLFELPTWPAGLAWVASTLYLLRNLFGAIRIYQTALTRTES